ncbi:hypothetical protein FACS1894139_14040 [Planctomycetales bacterium]|nr:hypothetical protein FACS1894107_02890 [Planctomycetales bacterium]GHS98995.1 hypothetical protein FACS1894108_08170 [Planctomycetales bacterium]GHT06965.1 hypothetical protein FACS1894139_14040 [Planctomycetales bacterium]
MRLPLWMRDLFPLTATKDEIRAVLAQFKITTDKSRFCALVSRWDITGVRTEIYRAVSAIAPVAAAGRLLHNDDSLQTQFGDDKTRYLRQFQFNICPENSAGDGYVTEKIWQAFAAGCIPIYAGYSRDPEPEILNPQAFLWWTVGSRPPADSRPPTDSRPIAGDDNAAVLAEIRALRNDEKLYRAFAARPIFLDTAVDKIHGYLQAGAEALREVVETQLRIKS